MSIVAALAFLGAASPQGAKLTERKPFVECDSYELTQAVPELAGIQFDSNQERLEGVLAATGAALDGMFAKLTDIAATEQIHEMRFEDGTEEASRQETYRYVVKLLPENSPEPFEESRVDPATRTPAPAPPRRPAGHLALRKAVALSAPALSGRAAFPVPGPGVQRRT
jgi:hypothetical protein